MLKGPNARQIRENDETTEIEQEALHRLLARLEDTYPKTAADRIAIKKARGALYD